jgi:predicted ATPase
MQIKRLVIENFKSIERIELVEPNPFTVFVGPNGSGKSTIFEALEFVNIDAVSSVARSLFGGSENFLRRQSNSLSLLIKATFKDFSYEMGYNEEHSDISTEEFPNSIVKHFEIKRNPLTLENLGSDSYRQFIQEFSRLFLRNEGLVKLRLNDDNKLSLSASNLEKVLNRVLSNEILKAEIFEWLELFVPGFKSVDIWTNPFSGEETLLWYEQSSEKPFTKDLISDGTYNILALLTAVYQSEEPQFLCIEEPENGLNPKVVKELVSLCRYACEEFGHFIWLNTHSQSLVSALTPEEIILVDKVEGATQVKQIKGMDLHGLPMDEAWLSKALGGGMPW